MVVKNILVFVNFLSLVCLCLNLILPGLSGIALPARGSACALRGEGVNSKKCTDYGSKKLILLASSEEFS